MTTERELKAAQEERLFEIFFLMEMSEKEYRSYLEVLAERWQSGMSSDEVAGVRERVQRSHEKRKAIIDG
jgi:hypothetical protein